MEKSTFETKEIKKEKGPVIELHFFRHSIKESDDVTLPSDDLVKLSEAGRNLAIEKAFDDVNVNQAVAFGSPRIRTQETAGLVMGGAGDDITGQESLSELKEKLNQNLKVGSKIGIDHNLNFTDKNSSPVGKAMNDAYSRGEYVKFMVEESDKLAEETEDTTGANYSAKATQIAKIIQKYVGILPKWEKLVQESPKEYENGLERYMGTHASVQEAFLVKVIEITDGVEARNVFVDMIGMNGFGYIEGFEADIMKGEQGNPIVKIRYNTEKGTLEKNLSLEQLQTIIQK